MTKIKDPIDPKLKSGAVYRVPCGGCNVQYVGETKRKTQTRLKEHESDCKWKRNEKSALADHHLLTGRDFDFDNAKVVRFESNYCRRIFCEAWEIKRERQHICANKFSGKVQLPDEYLQFCE